MKKVAIDCISREQGDLLYKILKNDMQKKEEIIKIGNFGQRIIFWIKNKKVVKDGK